MVEPLERLFHIIRIKFVTTDENSYVAEAVKNLQPKGRDSSYNTSNGEYVGIVTDSDIL